MKEYSNFVAVDDVKVNGKLTLGENTADNGGLRLAYIAFLADAKRKNIDLTQKAGRLHADPAILPGTRTELVRQHPPRATPAASANRSAFAPAIPGERRGAEHAGVRPGLRLQSRSAHDAGECLPGVVTRALTKGEDGIRARLSSRTVLRASGGDFTDWTGKTRPAGDEMGSFGHKFTRRPANLWVAGAD